MRLYKPPLEGLPPDKKNCVWKAFRGLDKDSSAAETLESSLTIETRPLQTTARTALGHGVSILDITVEMQVEIPKAAGSLADPASPMLAVPIFQAAWKTAHRAILHAVLLEVHSDAVELAHVQARIDDYPHPPRDVWQSPAEAERLMEAATR